MASKQHVAVFWVLCFALPNVSSHHIVPHVHSVAPSLDENVSKNSILSEHFTLLNQIVNTINDQLDQLGHKMFEFNLDLMEIKQAKLNLRFVQQDLLSANLCETFEFHFTKEIRTIARLLHFIMSVQGKNIFAHKEITVDLGQPFGNQKSK